MFALLLSCLLCLLSFNGSLAQAKNIEAYYWWPLERSIAGLNLPDSFNVLSTTLVLNHEIISPSPHPQYPQQYCWPIPKYLLTQKQSLAIYHPKLGSFYFPNVTNLYAQALPLFPSDTAYYLRQGIPQLLPHGYNLLALKFTQQTTSAQKNKLLDSICRSNQLVIAHNFEADIQTCLQQFEAGTCEKTFGCIQDVLSQIVWLKSQDGASFQLKDSSYLKLRNLSAVEWIGLPIESDWVVSNKLVIHLKKDRPDNFVDQLVERYQLEQHYLHSHYNYETDGLHCRVSSLIPSNELLQALLASPYVLAAEPEAIRYEHCD